MLKVTIKPLMLNVIMLSVVCAECHNKDLYDDCLMLRVVCA